MGEYGLFYILIVNPAAFNKTEPSLQHYSLFLMTRTHVTKESVSTETGARQVQLILEYPLGLVSIFSARTRDGPC